MGWKTIGGFKEESGRIWYLADNLGRAVQVRGDLAQRVAGASMESSGWSKAEL